MHQADLINFIALKQQVMKQEGGEQAGFREMFSDKLLRAWLYMAGLF
ncbi:hypothetical protein [Lelliottia sp. CFBP8978]|nr:hypothetical protein [Lelliottia sp. CFBP8978]